MTMVMALVVLAAAVALAPVCTAWLGRAAGWPLAALYLVAAGALTPAVSAVLAGEHPTWSAPWVPGLGVELALRADGLGIVFSLIALLIGAIVFAYSTRYLSRGPQLSFYLVMTAFTFSMVGLVLADDLILLFICWELTSLASYLLIARSGHAGEQASMRTLLMTFIGGLALLGAVAIIVMRTGTTSLSQALSAPVWGQDPGFAAVAAALVLTAGFTKSAQFPFHVWLPDAMAATTPVSAYLHAAAVVKAGIFLLLRFSPAFAGVPLWNAALITGGLVTAALGAWFALQQTDLKKLMAYSTVSQLGLIVATIGVGTTAALIAAVLHTIAHALFKSGLFMMVGVIDHATHTRDLRRLPVLYRAMPGSFVVTLLGCASMAGVPPMLGFLSKESVLAALREAPGPEWFGWAAMLGAAAASVLTFAYCAKIVFGAFVDGSDPRPVERVETGLVPPAALPILIGLPLGLFAAPLATVVQRAAEAASGRSVGAPHFTLWHGVTAELIATLVIFACGAVIIARRKALWPLLEHKTFRLDGAGVIRLIERRLRRAGALLARPVSVDYASRHLAALLAAFVAVVLGGLAAMASTAVPTAVATGTSRPIDVLLLVLIAASVLMVCRSDSRLAATVSLSAVGILATVQILALGAPDVGLTQLLVESLTVIVIMLVLQKLPLTFGRSSGPRRARTGTLAVLVGLAAGAGTWVLNAGRGRSGVAQYYIDEATPVTGGANIVNVILVEFRALDTLGELAVLGMAGVVLVAVLSTVPHDRLDPDAARAREHAHTPTPALRGPGSTAHRAIHTAWSNVVPLQLMLRGVIPVLAALSAIIFLRGHNEPGGGFIAALVGSAIVGLVYLSTSTDRQIGPPRLPVYLIGGGVLTAIATGLLGLVAKGSFLEPLHGYLAGVHVSSSMIFDVGVYTAVLGLVMIAFNLLGASTDSGSTPGSEGTRERVDEAVEGELDGPLDTLRGERPPRVGPRTSYIATGRRPRELGR
ncbi:MAG: DUF4040 family protein [Austwickia sp.]|nr:DUF4040 family protein [Austwickia sp.]